MVVRAASRRGGARERRRRAFGRACRRHRLPQRDARDLRSDDGIRDPEHLRARAPGRAAFPTTTRRRTRRSSRATAAVTRVVMAYFGLQSPATSAPRGARAAATSHARSPPSTVRPLGPRALRRRAGSTNVVSIAYWDDPARLRRLVRRTRPRWTGARLRRRPRHASSRCCGRRRALRDAVLLARSRRRRRSARRRHERQVQEHAYWGGMRDRIPLSQTDAMAPRGAPQWSRDGARVASAARATSA